MLTQTTSCAILPMINNCRMDHVSESRALVVQDDSISRITLLYEGTVPIGLW